jgi:hypothetical protein
MDENSYNLMYVWMKYAKKEKKHVFLMVVGKSLRLVGSTTHIKTLYTMSAKWAK